MKIAIDGRPLCRGLAGTAMFQKLAINSMLKYWKNVQLVLICPSVIPLDLRNEWEGSLMLIEDSKSILSKCSPFLWYTIKMPYFLRKINADLFWTPSPSLTYFIPHNTKKMIIVHDLVFKQFSNTMSWKNRLQSRLIFEYSLNHADYIWTNSLYTRTELLKYYPYLESVPIFTGLSVDNLLYRKIAVNEDSITMIQKKYNIINRKFILFVGTLEPRKNLHFLLSLMPEIFKRSGLKLLVVGGKGWNYNKIISDLMTVDEIKNATIFAGYITNEELANLYNMAYVCVSTSLNEGFGMPLLEALFCGCPVICPNNSAMKEVVDGIGTTIDGWNGEEWIETILHKVPARIENVTIPEKYNWKYIINNLWKFLQQDVLIRI